jgi:hypothetical protein
MASINKVAVSGVVGKYNGQDLAPGQMSVSVFDDGGVEGKRPAGKCFMVEGESGEIKN